MNPLPLALFLVIANAEEVGVDPVVAELTDVEGGCEVATATEWIDGITVDVFVQAGMTCETYLATLDGALAREDEVSFYRVEVDPIGLSPLDGDIDWLRIDSVQDGDIVLLVTEQDDQVDEIVHHLDEGWVEVNGVDTGTSDPGTQLELTEEEAIAAELLRDLVGHDFDEVLDPLL